AAASSAIAGAAVVQVAPAAASQLVVTEQPPDPIVAGQPFTLAVSALDPFGNVATSFNKPVSISLPNDPAVSMTVSARNGVATFELTTTSTSGWGSAITASSAGVTSVSSTPVTVKPPVNLTPPTVVKELVLHTQKKNKKGKNVGKPVFTGFQLVFSEAMNQA